MDSWEIAKALKLTAQLMELHEENPFKIRGITNAAFKLDKTGIDLTGKSVDEIAAIEGFGKSVATKIVELQTTGTLKELEKLVEKTPAGVIEMLRIKGIGPKKVSLLWKTLHIESVPDLLDACRENRLVEVKGFGAKTQEQVRKSIEFSFLSSGKYYYAAAEPYALLALEKLTPHAKDGMISLTGAIRRKDQVVQSIDVIMAGKSKPDIKELEESCPIPFNITVCEPSAYYRNLFLSSGAEKHKEIFGDVEEKEWESEHEIYKSRGYDFIEPELREGLTEFDLAKNRKLPKLIEFTDLRGILHNHTDYSDGIHTVQEMGAYCKKLGYEYLSICDHSQSAFYANGLKPHRIEAQQKEIDEVNKKMGKFRIFKGIESDILNDGSLDYPEEILKTFEMVVASVHSNLKMDKDKATARLIRAVENPYTTILGHPTGRQLLIREGYPIDHKKVIDACAANGVAIELNAHPYRLDIDWTWIPYCMEKGVMVSINPDAHEKESFYDMHYGVCVARKGLLTKEACLNALPLKDFIAYLQKKNPKVV